MKKKTKNGPGNIRRRIKIDLRDGEHAEKVMLNDQAEVQPNETGLLSEQALA